MNFRRLTGVTLVLALGCGDDDGDVTSMMTTGEGPSTSIDSSTQASTQDSETAPTTGSIGCGNGIMEAGEECDDGTQNQDSAKCKSDCKINICGDGALLTDMELCDDGNTDLGDGCDATCQIEAASLCPQGASDILINAGFEDGILPPWQSNGAASAIAGNPHSGMWSARVDGNVFLQQDLALAMPVLKLVSADFWSWHDISDEPAMLIEWVYDDNSVDSLIFGGTLDGWQMHDILDNLDPGKSLLGLRVWSYSSDAPAPDVSVFDDFRFCATP